MDRRFTEALRSRPGEKKKTCDRYPGNRTAESVKICRTQYIEQSSPAEKNYGHDASVRLVQLPVYSAHRRARHETSRTRLGVRVRLRVVAILREIPFRELVLLGRLLPDHLRGNEVERIVRASLRRGGVA